MKRRIDEVRTVDLRSVAGTERLGLIRVTLGGLPAGAYLELFSDEDPEPLLQQVSAELPGVLRWTALSGGEAAFHVAVFAPAPEVGAALMRFLAWQDELLDERLDEVDELASDAPLVSAAPAAKAFEEALAQHVEIEERMLFPLLEDLCPEKRTLHRLRMQHVSLRELAMAVTRALEDQDTKHFVKMMDALQSAMSAHHAIEQALMEALPQ